MAPALEVSVTLGKQAMTDQLKELVEKAASALKAAGAKEVYVFGSASKGKMRSKPWNEIARNVNEAAKGSSQIAANIVSVAQAAKSTTQGAAHSQTASQDLARMASEMEQLVRQFKFNQSGRSAGPAESPPTSERAHGGQWGRNGAGTVVLRNPSSAPSVTGPCS